MSNIEVSIQIHIKPTEETVTGERGMPSKMDDGCFQLIFDGKASCDIDALEDGLLRTKLSGVA